MPIPCVDVIVEKDARILIGFRAVVPYRNVWALPGGRILKDENPQESAKRNLKKIHISAEIKELVGVFSVMHLEESGPQRQGELAEYLGTEPYSLSRLLTKLEHSRYVIRTREAADKTVSLRKQARE